MQNVFKDQYANQSNGKNPKKHTGAIRKYDTPVNEYYYKQYANIITDFYQK